MKPQTYLKKMFGFSFLILTIAYSFTILIDPYQKSGFNILKKPYYNLGHQLAEDELKKTVKNAEFFILGSSRAQNIQSAKIEKLIKQNVFNFHIASGSLEEYIAAANFISQAGKAKVIYFQLDFFMFKESYSNLNLIKNHYLANYLSPYIEGNNGKKEYKIFERQYFSLFAFWHALKEFKTHFFRNWKKNQPPRPQIEIEKKPNKKFIVISENKTPAPPIAIMTKRVLFKKGYFQHQYDDFVVNETRIKRLLGYIKKITAENKIKLLVSMSPMNKEHTMRLRLDENLTKHWLHVKKIIASVFGSYFDFNNCSVSAFQGAKFWNDSVHPSPKLSTIMMKKILDQPLTGNIPDSFGTLITVDSIDSYISNMNKHCEKEFKSY
jgi:hypothetical protein